MKLREINAPNGKPITIRLLPFPAESQDIGGGTVDTGDGYFVAVNTNQSRRRQRRTVGHELHHIFAGHFDGDRDIAEIEDEANRAALWTFIRYRLRLL